VLENQNILEVHKKIDIFLKKLIDGLSSMYKNTYQSD